MFFCKCSVFIYSTVVGRKCEINVVVIMANSVDLVSQFFSVNPNNIGG